MGSPRPTLHQLEKLAARFFWGLPLLAVAIAYRTSPNFGFIGDAQFLIENNLLLRGPGALWQNLTHDYFWSSSGNALPYWRPLTKGSWVLEYWLWNGWAGGFHLVQVGILLAAVAGVMFLVRRAGGGRMAALVAGLLFGLHPDLVEPVCSIMARSDVMVAAASVWAVASWLAWAQTRRLLWAAAHGLCLVLALGSKEVAVTLPVVLALWIVLGTGEAGHGFDAGRVRQRLLFLSPALLVAIGFFLGRRAVLGARAGIPIEIDGARLLLAGGQALWGSMPFHLGPAVLSLPRPPPLFAGVVLAAVAGWGAFVTASLLAVRWRARLTVGLLLWLVSSLAPILLVSKLNVPVAPSLFPLAGRWATTAIAATSVLLGLALARLPWPRARAFLVAGAVAWAAIMMVGASASHAKFRDTDSLSRFQDEAYLATAEPLRTQSDRCDFAERQILRALNGRDPTRALLLLDGLAAGCRSETRFEILRLGALVDLSRWAEAQAVVVPLLQTGSAEMRYHAEVMYLAGVTAAALGDRKAALTRLNTALSMGHPACNLRVQLGLVLAQEGRAAEGAREYEAAAGCAPSDGRPLLAAAALWLQAGWPTQAAAALQRARALPLDSEQLRVAETLRARLGSQ